MRCTPALAALVLWGFGPVLCAQERAAPIRASLAIKKADRILSASPVSLDALAAWVMDKAIEQTIKKIENPPEPKLIMEAMFTDQFTRQDYRDAKETLERVKRSVTSAQCFNRPVRASVIVDRANASDNGTIHVEGSLRARRLHTGFQRRNRLSDEAVQHFERVSVLLDIPSDIADKVDLRKLENAKTVIFTVQVVRFDIGSSTLSEKHPAESDSRWIITSVSGQVTSVGRNVLK